MTLAPGGPALVRSLWLYRNVVAWLFEAKPEPCEVCGEDGVVEIAGQAWLCSVCWALRRHATHPAARH
jgi:hypothetical protein